MSKFSIITFALMTGLGINAMALAMDTPPASTMPVSQLSQKADSRPVKPGDRNCLRDTGSLIPAKKGSCLPVTGRSYNGDELRRTGQQNNARALQMLDPSISIGH
jgi:hypothetical protein